eukprot:3305401-Pleurochrysis_carterae.AAC.1
MQAVPWSIRNQVQMTSHKRDRDARAAASLEHARTRAHTRSRTNTHAKVITRFLSYGESVLITATLAPTRTHTASLHARTCPPRSLAAFCIAQTL